MKREKRNDLIMKGKRKILQLFKKESWRTCLRKWEKREFFVTIIYTLRDTVTRRIGIKKKNVKSSA